MNARIKARWLKALRSGKYRQGKHRLHGTDGTFCCLGVLCDLAVKSKVIDKPIVVVAGDRFHYAGYSAELPSAVVTWAELPDQNPDVDVAEKEVSLAELNDGGKSFKQIANIIERQL